MKQAFNMKQQIAVNTQKVQEKLIHISIKTIQLQVTMRVSLPKKEAVVRTRLACPDSAGSWGRARKRKDEGEKQ